MPGDIKIYFGEIVDIEDDKKLYRCRVRVNGHTNEIAKENLPWYFPWYGLNYLPEIGDKTSLIVFDNNFSTGFYGRKVGLTSSSLSDSDYANYLEIFSRSINDKLVKLTYIESEGIVFANDKSNIQIELDKITLFVDGNSIKIDKDYIHIGNDANQFSLLGDKGRELMADTVNNLETLCNNMIQGLTQLSAVATPNPYTTALSAPIGAMITTLTQNLTQITALKPKYDANVIQSKKTKIE